MLSTLRGFKRISSKHYANLRWYSLLHFLTQWSISLYIYRSRQKLEDWSSIDGCTHSNGEILQLQWNSYLKVFSMFFLIGNTWIVIQCRYLFNLKKKVKNKAHVEASICEAYIVEEISTFISYYFEPHMRTRINRVPRHDDGGEVPSSGNLSIFSNTGRPIPKNAVRGRYLSEIEFKQAHNYVLFNCDELRPFIQ